MALKQDGGLAHPNMTLRDWFAGQALAGLCANIEQLDLNKVGKTPGEILTEQAYHLADRMLEERRK